MALGSQFHFPKPMLRWTLHKNNANKDDLIQARDRGAVVLLWNVGTGDDLVASQHKQYKEKVETNMFRQMVYHTSLSSWRGEAGYLYPEELNQQDWLWKWISPVPKDLMCIFLCKTGCDSKRLTDKKHGLECTSACSNCTGLVIQIFQIWCIHFLHRDCGVVSNVGVK